MFKKSRVFMAIIITLILMPSVIAHAAFSLADVYSEGERPSAGVLNGLSVFADDDAVVTNDISGTAIVFGNTVSVKSNIDGDLLIFGNNISVSGEVTGNVYCFGNDVNLMGKMQKDVIAFGNIITFSNESEVVRDLLAFGNKLTLNGKTGRNAHVACATAQISGEIGKDAKVSADTVNVSNTAVITGTLYYQSEKDALVNSGAKIGDVQYTKAEPITTSKKNVQVNVILKLAMTLGGTLLIWLFITFLAPIFGKKTVFAFRNKFPRTLLTGFIALIAIPVLSVILMITVAGVGIGVSLGFLYGIAIYLSLGVVSYAAANAIVQKLRWKPIHKNVWYVLIASLAIKGLTMIPYVGGYIMFAIILVGIGLLLSFLFRKDNFEEVLEA